MTYQTSKDYERLWELLIADANILFRWAGRGQMAWQDRSVSWGLPISEGRKEDIINTWENGGLEFIDPASQTPQNLWHGPEERPETDDPIFVVYLKGDFAIDSYIGPHYVAEDDIGSWKAESELIKRWAYVDEMIKETGGGE